jgi:hypothetical protein
MKITLPCHGIEVKLGPPDPQRPGAFQGGVITSNLKEPCPHCGQEDCQFDCDGSQGADDEHARDDGRIAYNAAIDGIEALILSAAVAGTDISTPAFIEAVETAVDVVSNA